MKLWSEDGDLSGNYDLFVLFANILRDLNAVSALILTILFSSFGLRRLLNLSRLDCSIAKFVKIINEKKTLTTIFNTTQESSSRQLAARLCMTFVLLFFIMQHFTPLPDQIEDWPCFRLAYKLEKRFVFLKRSSLQKIVQCLFYLMRIIIILRSTIVMKF